VNFVRDEDGVPWPDRLARLVAAIAAEHDRAAFGALFNHLGPRLKSFLMKGGLAANVAEEIVQETMLTVWRKASSFDPARGSASTWIFTIARNLRIDLGRRSRRDTPRPADPTDDLDYEEGPDIAMLTAEREGRLRQALASLSDEQAAVLRLSFFSDIPHAEISQELGIPLGTVKSRIRLAVNKLRTLLDDLS
jgi:RNA polymerase sigma-70 factor (ECF subfamily)